MNRFYIEETPQRCAMSHCDSHVVKMILEEAQMLSTAHRVLDGEEGMRTTKGGRNMASWKICEGDYAAYRENNLYIAVHVNHPCSLWCRETLGNYGWALQLFCALSREFRHRYWGSHKSHRELYPILMHAPRNIDRSMEITPMPMAMGGFEYCINKDDPIESYRNFYISKQKRFSMTWKNRRKPEWWIEENDEREIILDRKI